MPTSFSQRRGQEADGVQAEKLALRLSMNAIRDSLSPETRKQAALALAERVRAGALDGCLPDVGGIVGLYVAIRSELDLAPTMEVLAEMGYRIALPRLNGAHMSFHLYRHGEPLRAGPLRTREPGESAAEVLPAIVLTPLLAFDRQSRRLGYGMGYYDRFFAEHPEIARIGVAFACQEVAQVPVAVHDQPLMTVLTES